MRLSLYATSCFVERVYHAPRSAVGAVVTDAAHLARLELGTGLWNWSCSASWL
jgi:hypothetical protein